MTDLASAPTRWPQLQRLRACCRPLVSGSWRSARAGRRLGVATGKPRGRRRPVVTCADLADRIDVRRAALGRTRRLVQLGGVDDVEAIVTLLAALDGGHPLIVSDAGRSEREIAATYRPDIVVTGRGDDLRVEQSTSWSEPSRHDLHPELALLISTSGTTGGAKLVRLSRDAVLSNALAIAESLGLDDRDRAVTSLPIHYCYGLSVVTSHLAVGASVVITDTSVVDPCFWAAVERWGVTTLAGVPYTFEMIERLGADVMRTPSLRLVTQAGGRLDPAAVRRWAEHGRSTGWDFVVMYGQTEATARMAVASPADTYVHPASVGRAIPGGAFRIGPVPAGCTADHRSGDGVGEVIYCGPNVMLGYATRAAGPLPRARRRRAPHGRSRSAGRSGPSRNRRAREPFREAARQAGRPGSPREPAVVGTAVPSDALVTTTVWSPWPCRRTASPAVDEDLRRDLLRAGVGAVGSTRRRSAGRRAEDRVRQDRRPRPRRGLAFDCGSHAGRHRRECDWHRRIGCRCVLARPRAP